MRDKIVIFLPINLNMCFGCSKEPLHYTQHYVLDEKRKILAFQYALVSGGLGLVARKQLNLILLYVNIKAPDMQQDLS